MVYQKSDQSPPNPEATPKPASYNLGITLGFVIAIIIGLIGLLLGIIGTKICIKPIMQSSNPRDRFEEDNLEDIYND